MRISPLNQVWIPARRATALWCNRYFAKPNCDWVLYILRHFLCIGLLLRTTTYYGQIRNLHTPLLLWLAGRPTDAQGPPFLPGHVIPFLLDPFMATLPSFSLSFDSLDDLWGAQPSLLPLLYQRNTRSGGVYHTINALYRIPINGDDTNRLTSHREN